MNRYFVFLSFLLLGCDGDNPTPQKEKYATLELIKGNNQTGITGRVLDDTLILKVNPLNKNYRPELFYLTAEYVSGNGNAYGAFNPGYPATVIPSDFSYIFKILWQLGCNQNDQAIKFNLFYQDSCNIYYNPTPPCEPIDSFTFDATSYTPHGWNRSCGFNWVDQYNTHMRVYNGEIYAINSGTLYKAFNAEAMSWEKVPGVPVNDIYDFDFTSAGEVYLLTENHGVYTSKDLNEWNSMSSGILDPRYPKSILVEDSVVYVSFLFDGLYRLRPTKDNFWKKLLINGSYSEEYDFPVRHPNGDLYVVDKWDDYWVSENSGDTWVSQPIEYKYVNYQTEDLKIHPASGLIYIGSGDASLAILSPDTYTGDLHSYYQWNASSQLINNIIFHEDNVYYLVNYTPNPGIYSSDNGWQKIDVGFDEPINQFILAPEENFLLGSYDGVYYWKE